MSLRKEGASQQPEPAFEEEKPRMETLWDHRYAQRTQRMASSAIRELLKLTEQPGIISFGGGLPAPEVFPVKQVEEAAVRVLRDMGAQALQYGTTEGYLPLREMIARHTARFGLERDFYMEQMENNLKHLAVVIQNEKNYRTFLRRAGIVNALVNNYRKE